jgi:hypothetical protein
MKGTHEPTLKKYQTTTGITAAAISHERHTLTHPEKVTQHNTTGITAAAISHERHTLTHPEKVTQHNRHHSSSNQP